MITLLRIVTSIILIPLTTAAADLPAERTLSVTEPRLKLADATPEQAKLLATYIPASRTFDASLRESATGDEPWRLLRVRFPSPVKTPWDVNNTVPGEIYLPRSTPGKVPGVVVLDIMDGSAIVPRGLARGLAEQGVAAIYIPMACYGARRPADAMHFKYFAENPERTPDNLRQTVMDIRRARAVLAALPEVDADRIAITGVSLGGIMTSLAAGVDGTFWRVVPILAGGDIASICFHETRETRRIREACEAKGIDRDALAEILRGVEPLTFASRIDPARCLMINATRDEVIPPPTTAALHKAIGAPQMLTIPVGHYGSILFLPNIRTRLIEYLQGKPVETLKLTN